MDLSALKQLLVQNSIPKINQICESKYHVTSDIKDVKLNIVEKFCSNNGYKLCVSEEDSILASLSGQSDEAIDYLADHGYMVVREDKKIEKVLTESNILATLMAKGRELSKELSGPIGVVDQFSIEQPQDVNDNRYPYFKKIPLDHFDLACPYCNAVMREKDFSFKYDMANKCWTHNCKPDARMLMEPR